MAFVTLEDFSGSVDVTIFPNVFRQAMNIILPGDIVVVEGRVDRSNETVQLLADKVIVADDYAPDFWLTIPAQLDNSATIDALKKIFSAHKGWTQVFLNHAGKWRRLTQTLSDSAELRGELTALLGAENVRTY